jgi:phospholipase C
MGAMDEIRHLVVLMLENQSFDRLLGYLDLGDRTQKLEGLTGTETNPVSPPTDMTRVPVNRVSAASAYVTDPGPGHDFEDVNQQLFADRAPADTSAPGNAGFVLNYSQQTDSRGRRLGDRGRDIMQCLDPALVPILTTLAREFTVCDHWFSSVPGPTWPNRFFLHAGTAKGFLVTPETGQLVSQFWTSPYDMPTIFENLNDRGLTWTVYFDDYAQAFALRRLHPCGDRFQRYEQFARDIQNGTLPTYAFIEPRSFSAPGYPANDQHPQHDGFYDHGRPAGRAARLVARATLGLPVRSPGRVRSGDSRLAVGRGGAGRSHRLRPHVGAGDDQEDVRLASILDRS